MPDISEVTNQLLLPFNGYATFSTPISLPKQELQYENG